MTDTEMLDFLDEAWKKDRSRGQPRDFTIGDLTAPIGGPYGEVDTFRLMVERLVAVRMRHITARLKGK